MEYVKNDNPNGDLEIADLGILVAKDQWAEVPEEHAKELVKQSVWSLVDKKGKSKAIPKSWFEEGDEAEPEASTHEIVGEDGPEITNPSESSPVEPETKPEEAN